MSKNVLLVLLILSFMVLLTSPVAQADSLDNERLDIAKPTLSRRDDRNDLPKQIRPTLRDSAVRNGARERAAEFIEAREKRMEEFKERLAEIKDDRQRTALENINTWLGRFNTSHTDMLHTVTTNLEHVLNMLEDKTNTLKAEGKDVTATDEALAQARVAIADAYSAIEIQSEKDYTISITDSSTLRADAKAAKEALRSDLQAVRSVVRTAHQAVKNVAIALAQARE